MTETGESPHVHDHEDGFAGLYRKDLMLGTPGAGDPEHFPLTGLSAAEVAAVLVGVPDGYEGVDVSEELEEAAGAATVLLESVSVFRVSGGTDPWVVEEESEGEFVRVRVLRLATHSGRSETADKVVSGNPADAFVGHRAVDGRGTVAVVDAGLPASWKNIPLDPLPSTWLSQTSPALDTEGNHPWEVKAGPGSVGHGLFVSHLISRLSGARVRIAKMGILDPDLVTKRDAAIFRTELARLRNLVLLADELQVFFAVYRLADTPPTEGFVALNLSFAYHDHEGGGLGLAGPAVLAAVRLWWMVFGCAPIFAAAGNVVPGGKHAPEHQVPEHEKSLLTTINGVISVGSLDEPGGAVSDFSDREYDWLAVGRDATGISDLTVRRTTWSGTSFACAVATAAYVRNRRLNTLGKETIDLDPRI